MASLRLFFLIIGAALALPNTASAVSAVQVLEVIPGQAHDFGDLGDDGAFVSFCCGRSYSDDGRYLVFGSRAANLVSDDINNDADVFVRDRQTGAVTLVSRNSANEQGNAGSFGGAISADGRYVAFYSLATNLAASDTNGVRDVFVRDLIAGTTVRVSEGTGGVQGNGESRDPSISSDGRYVTFESTATNLTAGDANGRRDVFLHDRMSGITSLISVSSAGVQGNLDSRRPSISGDGSRIAWESSASTLVLGDSNSVSDVFVRDVGSVQTIRVSVGPAGAEGVGASSHVRLSSNGQVVAFTSSAENLDVNDANLICDAFVHDLSTATTELVTPGSNGQGLVCARWPDLSADGSFVAFVSDASNLVANDSNGLMDAFVRDRTSGTTSRVSVTPAATEFQTGDIADVAVSADGSLISWLTDSSEFVALDDNGHYDVVTRDLGAGTNSLDSRAGLEAPIESVVNGDTTWGCFFGCLRQLSEDGQIAVFTSEAGTLVPGDSLGSSVFAFDRVEGMVTKPPGAFGAPAFEPTVSADGRFVAYVSNDFGLAGRSFPFLNDIFVFDLQTEEVEVVSVNSAGELANNHSSSPVVSSDGRYVAFRSFADNLVADDLNGRSDIFIRDRVAGETTRISVSTLGGESNGESYGPSISHDGRFVAFTSLAANLDPDDLTLGGLDIFVRDRLLGTTEVASLNDSGGQASGDVLEVSISADGRFLAYSSGASNIVAGDMNGASDVFVLDRQTGIPERISVSALGLEGNGSSFGPSISSNGRFVAFQTDATNLVPGDLNGTTDVIVFDRLSGIPRLMSTDANGVPGDGNSTRASIAGDGSGVLFTSTSGNWNVTSGGVSTFEDAFFSSIIEIIFRSDFENDP